MYDYHPFGIATECGDAGNWYILWQHHIEGGPGRMSSWLSPFDWAFWPKEGLPPVGVNAAFISAADSERVVWLLNSIEEGADLLASKLKETHSTSLYFAGRFFDGNGDLRLVWVRDHVLGITHGKEVWVTDNQSGLTWLTSPRREARPLQYKAELSEAVLLQDEEEYDNDNPASYCGDTTPSVYGHWVTIRAFKDNGDEYLSARFPVPYEIASHSRYRAPYNGLHGMRFIRDVSKIIQGNLQILEKLLYALYQGEEYTGTRPMIQRFWAAHRAKFTYWLLTWPRTDEDNRQPQEVWKLFPHSEEEGLWYWHEGESLENAIKLWLRGAKVRKEYRG